MALSLTAEQKTIFEIFSGKNQYIIPPYQRPYSWSENQCMELFDDLKKAYAENKSEGYFLGNIVVAKSKEDRNRLEVVDGQQRLTTLTLLMHVLLHFDSDNEDLDNGINIPGGRRNDEKRRRLKTNVFIEKDARFLEEALNIDFNNKKTISKSDNQFKKNIHYFYTEVNSFQKETNLFDFTDFFMNDVSLLPIQTEDDNPEKAREKALKIFETINNRGLSLSDSDIFKAKLYSKALNLSKHEDFIQKWKDLDEECQNINYTINDIFRFYTQIIRGKEGIKTTEIGLREFFTQRDYSPFNKVPYDEILNDLFRIIEAIKFFNTVIENPAIGGELTKWFQLIREYTNQYPLNTLLVYLYTNNLEVNPRLLSFSKNLVRYVYYQGSTSRIKFFIFDLIIKVAKAIEEEFEYYPEKIKEDDFTYFGMLKKGYSLLCFYLTSNQEAIYPYHFDKIIHPRHASHIDETWKEHDINDFLDTVGNMQVLDIYVPRESSLERKSKLLYHSSIDEVKEVAENIEEWSFHDYLDREERLQKQLKAFFEKPNEN